MKSKLLKKITAPFIICILMISTVSSASVDDLTQNTIYYGLYYVAIGMGMDSTIAVYSGPSIYDYDKIGTLHEGEFIYVTSTVSYFGESGYLPIEYADGEGVIYAGKDNLVRMTGYYTEEEYEALIHDTGAAVTDPDIIRWGIVDPNINETDIAVFEKAEDPDGLPYMTEADSSDGILTPGTSCMLSGEQFHDYESDTDYVYALTWNGFGCWLDVEMVITVSEMGVIGTAVTGENEMFSESLIADDIPDSDTVKIIPGDISLDVYTWTEVTTESGETKEAYYVFYDGFAGWVYSE